MRLRHVRTDGAIVILASQQGEEFRVEHRALSDEDQAFILAQEATHGGSAVEHVVRPRDHVVTKIQSASLTLLNGQVETCDMGLPLDVREIRGNRLLVRGGGKTGWIARDEVVAQAQAVGYFTTRINETPYAAWPYYARGFALLAEGKYDMALEDANRALRKTRNEPAFYNLRGICWDHKAAWREALADYSSAVELDPDNALFFYNRASTFIEQGNDVEAMADINKAIRLDPTNCMYCHQRGQVYLLRRDYDQLVSDCTHAIKLDPHHAPAYRERGIVLLDQKGDMDGPLRDGHR
jgi:tetratricopeptide (TPR) repeat protein